MLNFIIVHGRLAKDPEARTTQSGVSVCNFTVAVDRSHTKGEEKQTDFIDVVAWRGLSDLISKYFVKGKEIIVQGSLQSRRWQDGDGKNRVSWEILADSVDFCGTKSSGGCENTEPNVNDDTFTGSANVTNLTDVIETDEDLPF